MERVKEIVEDIVVNNGTSESVAEETILSDNDLEFGSDINDDLDDLDDNIPFIYLANSKKTKKLLPIIFSN